MVKESGDTVPYLPTSPKPTSALIPFAIQKCKD